MSATISNFHPGSYLNHPPQQALVKHKQDIDSLKKDDDSKKTKLSVSEQKESEKTEQEKQSKLQQIKNRDREVRTHEQAHLSTAGAFATSGASFSFTKGSDGGSYATGGEVSIDTSPVKGDPAATIRKADIIRRAALAPASPSSQDQLVASKATAMAEKARAELFKKTQEVDDQKTTNHSTDSRYNFENRQQIDLTV